MNEIRIEVLLSRIQDEILKRAGKGFAIEISAEITKYEIYKRKAPSIFACIVSDGVWTWQLCRTNTEVKRLSKFQRRIDDTIYFDRVDCVDWDIDISPEIEKQLPKGVIVNRTLPVVLYDGRDYVPNILSEGPMVHIRRLEEERKRYGHVITSTKEKEGRKADYIEGRRVFLSVTDEYALQLFNEVCDSRYPFRKLLLSTYDQILKEIALTWGYPLYGYSPKSELHFEISYSKIFLRNTYEGDGMGYNGHTIWFKTLGMRDLNSYEQLYGMAIAIIDTIKAKYSELDQVMYTIEHDKDSVRVHGVMPAQSVVKTADALKEW